MKNQEEFHLKTLGIIFILSIICYFAFRNINEHVEYFLFMIVMSVGFFSVINFSVFAIQYIGVLIGKIVGSSERKIKQLDKTDFKFDKEYYREILKNSSPLIIGYMDNLELNKNKIIAELLYLQKRNLIILEDDKIKKAANHEKVYLLPSERLIMEHIYDNKFRTSDYDMFLERLKDRVICESEYLSLVKEKKEEVKTKEFNIDWYSLIKKYLRNNCICTSYFIFTVDLDVT